MNVTYDLPHETDNCTGGWAGSIYGAWICWRCAGCWAVCDDAPGVLEAIERERAVDILLVRLTRAGENMLPEGD